MADTMQFDLVSPERRLASAQVTSVQIPGLERALSREEMTQEKMDELMEEAKNTYSKVKEETDNEPGPVDDAAKLLADMVAMGDHMGLSAKP